MLEFHCGGIRFRFSFLFFWIFTLLFLLDRSGIMLLGGLAAVMHELGHGIAFLLTGDLPEEVSFELTGIRMVRKQHPLSLGRELFQLLMGSGVNFAVFLLLSGGLQAVNKLSMFAVSHLVLGIFNLLPVSALDGGKILRLILERFLGIRRAYLIAKATSIAVSVLICILGGLLIWSGKGSFSLLLIGVWMLLLCMKE